ncbi:MAG: hypothetical protein LBD46_05640 [Endomicrobium sp.]|jgi:hypothetical protein|nr:hypothetical protein [Endomicrobium sp.]
MSIFEAVMMLCFGSAWPFSIYKSYISRSNKGKSIWFLIIVIVGYLSGILYKILYNFDYVVAFYIFNLLLVAADSALYFRNYIILKKETA